MGCGFNRSRQDAAPRSQSMRGILAAGRSHIQMESAARHGRDNTAPALPKVSIMRIRLYGLSARSLRSIA